MSSAHMAHGLSVSSAILSACLSCSFWLCLHATCKLSQISLEPNRFWAPEDPCNTTNGGGTGVNPQDRVQCPGQELRGWKKDAAM
jgi:hypothetical protein